MQISIIITVASSADIAYHFVNCFVISNTLADDFDFI